MEKVTATIEQEEAFLSSLEASAVSRHSQNGTMPDGELGKILKTQRVKVDKMRKKAADAFSA